MNSCEVVPEVLCHRIFLITDVLCRIMFGSSHLYVFYHPEEAKKLKAEGKLIEVSYESAQEEIAKNAGFKMKKKEQSNGKFSFVF